MSGDVAACETAEMTQAYVFLFSRCQLGREYRVLETWSLLLNPTEKSRTHATSWLTWISQASAPGFRCDEKPLIILE